MIEKESCGGRGNFATRISKQEFASRIQKELPQVIKKRAANPMGKLAKDVKRCCVEKDTSNGK
jgi:hypothetical protein